MTVFVSEKGQREIQLGTAACQSKLLQSIYTVFPLAKRPGQTAPPEANPGAAGISDTLSGGQNV